MANELAGFGVPIAPTQGVPGIPAPSAAASLANFGVPAAPPVAPMSPALPGAAPALAPLAPPQFDLTNAVEDEEGIWIKQGEKLFTIAPDKVGDAAGIRGVTLASPQDVQAKKDEIRVRGSESGFTAALTEFGIGIADGVSAVGRGGAALASAAAGALGATEAEQDLQGFARDAGGNALAKDIAYLLGGVEGEHEFVRAYAAREKAFPMLTAVARGAGLLVPAIATAGAAGAAQGAGTAAAEAGASSLAARLATTILSPSGIQNVAASGALSGIAGGAAAPFETMDDTPISREAILWGGAMGGILGGALGGTVGAAGKYAPGVLSKVFGKTSSLEARKVAEAEVRSTIPETIRGMAESTVPAERELFDSIMERGVKAGKGVQDMADRIEQSVAKAGPNPEAKALAAQEAVERELGRVKSTETLIAPEDWRSKTLSPDNMVRNRDSLKIGARNEITDHLSSVIDESDKVMEHLKSFEVKAPLVRKNLANLTEEETTAAIGASLSRVRAMREEFNTLFGGAAPGNVRELNSIGLENSQYLRTGMRDESLTKVRGAFAGKSAVEAQDIALGKAPSATGERMKPVDVSVFPDEGNGPIFNLADGRHRMAVARDAGATHINARIRYYDADGNVLRTEQAPLSIGREAPSPVDTIRPSRSSESLGFSFNEAEEALAKAGDAAEAYVAMDKLRRGVNGRLAALYSQTRSTLADDAFEGQKLFKFADNAYEQTRQFLADPAVWKEQGNLQLKVNQAWADDISSSGRVTKLGAFTSRDVSGRYGQQQARVDPDKIEKFLDGLGKKTLPDQDLRAMIDTKINLMKEVGAAYDIPKASLDKAIKSAEGLRDSVDAAQKVMTESGGLETWLTGILAGRMARMTGNAAGGLIGATIGSVGGPAGTVAGALAGHSVGAALEEYAAHRIPKVITSVLRLKDTVGLGVNKLPDVYQKQLARASLSSIPVAVRGLFESTKLAGRDAQLDAYEKRTDAIAKLATSPELMTAQANQNLSRFGTVQPTLPGTTAAAAHERVLRMINNWPGKQQAPSIIKSKAGTSPSDQDLKLAEAMWEATTKPMSTFDDFENGTMDPDKAKWTWVQYPELQKLFQASAIDTLSNAPEDAVISSNALAQLDFFLGFDGALQTTLNRSFSARIDAIGAEQAKAAQQPPQGPALELPGAKPTRNERLMGVS